MDFYIVMLSKWVLENLITIKQLITLTVITLSGFYTGAPGFEVSRFPSW